MILKRQRFLAYSWIKTTLKPQRSMEVPLVNPPQCRLCGLMGHRTSQCPEMSDDGEKSLELVGETSWEQQQELELHMAEERNLARKEAPKNMEVETYARDRGPAARASAALGARPRSAAAMPKKVNTVAVPKRAGRLQRGLPLSEDDPDQIELVETEDIQGLTAEELKLIHRRRTQQQVRSQQKVATQALTGWEAPYPSLSNVFSDDLACNVMKSTCSRLRTYLWKKLVWQLRVREAVKIESKGKAVWKKNPRWLSLLLSYEVASLWGHFGAMRQRLRNADFLALGTGR